MSRSPKRLARILTLRRRQEEAARIQLARSMEKAAEISDEVRARTDALESVLAGEMRPHERTQLDVLADAAMPAIVAAKAASASAVGAVAELRQEWVRTAVRMKGLERLEERRIETERLEDQRDEALRLQDAVSARLRKDDE